MTYFHTLLIAHFSVSSSLSISHTSLLVHTTCIHYSQWISSLASLSPPPLPPAASSKILLTAMARTAGPEADSASSLDCTIDSTYLCELQSSRCLYACAHRLSLVEFRFTTYGMTITYFLPFDSCIVCSFCCMRAMFCSGSFH